MNKIQSCLQAKPWSDQGEEWTTSEGDWIPGNELWPVSLEGTLKLEPRWDNSGGVVFQVKKSEGELAMDDLMEFIRYKSTVEGEIVENGEKVNYFELPRLANEQLNDSDSQDKWKGVSTENFNI